jgi:hypothetical protein
MSASNAKERAVGHYAERLFEQLPVARFRCWNDNIDLEEKFLPQQGILSRYGPVALPAGVVARSRADAYGCGFNGLRKGATRVLLARSTSGIE